jgi:hypothetical protein
MRTSSRITTTNARIRVAGMRSSIPNGRPGRAFESAATAVSGECSTTTRARRNASAFGLARVLGHYAATTTTSTAVGSTWRRCGIASCDRLRAR